MPIDGWSSNLLPFPHNLPSQKKKMRVIINSLILDSLFLTQKTNHLNKHKKKAFMLSKFLFLFFC